MKKLLLLALAILSMSTYAQDKNCKVDVIFPYGTEEVEQVEVLNTFDGPIT